MSNNLGNEPGMAGVVERNIEALLPHRKQQEANKSFEERIADGFTRFTGSMTFVYIHLYYLAFGLFGI